jgi:hypothetical protein
MCVHAYIRRASCSLKSRNFVYIRFRRLSVSTSNPVEAVDGAIYLPDRCIQISSSSSSSSTFGGTRAISLERDLRAQRRD